MRKTLSIVLALIIYAFVVFAVNVGIPRSAYAATPSDIAGDCATPALSAVARLSPCASDAAKVCGLSAIPRPS